MKKTFLILCAAVLVSVPLLSFADIKYQVLAPLPNIGQSGDHSVTVNEAFFSIYLNQLYMLGVALCTGLAILMIVIGGVQWASSDAWSKKQEGKERIWAAVLGLLIALGSYVILNTINPDLLKTKLEFGGNTNSQALSSTPVGPKTAEERRVAETTPTTRPQADPNYTPEFNEDGTMKVRSTYYNVEENGDEDTNNLRSSTGTPLRPATATQVGVAAVDPSLIPYGSLITVQTADGPRYYVAADTGGAVKSREASGNTVPVIDFFSTSQVAEEYTNVQVQPYTGTPKYINMSGSQKESFFNINNFTKPSGSSNGGVQIIPTPPKM